MTLKRKSVVISLSIIIILGLVAGGYIAYQHDMIPGIHQNIESSFDSNKTVQRIGPENMKIITPQEAEQQDLLTPKVTVDKEANTITLETLFVTTTSDKAPLNTTLIKDRFYKRRNLTSEDMQSKWDQEVYEVPANFPIVLPKDMHYAAITGQPGTNEGDSPSIIVGFFYDQKNKVTFVVNYYNENQIPFNPSIQNTDWNTYKEILQSPDGWKNLPVSDGISPISTTSQ
ncbi:MAG: hypothetical protein JW712_04815 [Dehalococcoidales bacterium]|nr:hypothetical protein [Dehalococcoidales bacterium]